jgi:CHAT domain-containing protein
MDRVCSSYAPSLRLLAHLNREAAGAEPIARPARLLAVGLSETPRLANSQLPNVTRELAAASRDLPPNRRTVLHDEKATVAAVKRALPHHDLFHFACHGKQYPRDPASSKLYLHDGHLSVGELRWSELRHSRLAVLSACETAMSGVTLMNEGLHLGAAMHVAGCPEVVGSLWSVGDTAAAQVVEGLYARVIRAGTFHPEAVATALHAAALELRAEVPDLYSSWAPFVHLGAGR